MAGIALPPVAMQRLLDDVADNGAESLLAHRAAVRAFHDRLRAYFYPYIFEERPFGARDFAAMPRPVEARSAPRPSPLPWLGLIAWLILACAALMREATAPSFSGRERGGLRFLRRRGAVAQDAGGRV
jgi:ABC-2 type transport system permease protein